MGHEIIRILLGLSNSLFILLLLLLALLLRSSSCHWLSFHLLLDLLDLLLGCLSILHDGPWVLNFRLHWGLFGGGGPHNILLGLRLLLFLVRDWGCEHLHFGWVRCWELRVHFLHWLWLLVGSLLVGFDLLELILALGIEVFNLLGLLTSSALLLLLHKDWLLILVMDEKWKLVTCHRADHIGR